MCAVSVEAEVSPEQDERGHGYGAEHAAGDQKTAGA
jgi:hypothetical protein